MKIVLGLFKEYRLVKTAVSSLEECGFEQQKIAILTSGDGEEIRDLLDKHSEERTLQTALLGTGVGSVLGLLGSIALIPIPGIGPILASGVIGTAAGGVMGGFFGSLAGARSTVQSEYDIKEELADGNLFLMIEANESNEQQAVACLKKAQASYVTAHEVDEETQQRLAARQQ